MGYLLAQSKIRSLCATPSRWWPPRLLGLMLGLIFILAIFTFNSAIMVVPRMISSSSSSSSPPPPPPPPPPSSSSASLPWPSLFRPSTTFMFSNKLIFPLLFRNPALYSHAAQHQENIPSSISMHSSPPHPYMPSHEKQSVSTSHDQSSSPSIDSRSSKIAHSNGMGHDDNGFSSSPADSTDMRLSLTDITDGMGHGNDDDNLNSSLANGADGRRHVHDGFSSSTHDSTNPHCNIYIGRWVEDDRYPLYKPESCPFVEEKFNCQKNGRRDDKYTRWRWTPRDCNMPRFNGTDMLERLRGKRLVFVGDSLSRNQWESMLCMLRESLADKSRVVRARGNDQIWRFLDYNCSVEFYTSRFLVDTQEDSSETHFNITLDTIDKSEGKWRNANVLVFNTDHWWGPSKIGQGKNCFQERNKVYSKLDVMLAYNKALSTWARWVDKYINTQNTSVFYRTHSPIHFKGGEWNSGGQCQDEIEPIYEDSNLAPYPNKFLTILEGVVQEMRVPVHVLNITRLSSYRKDSHPALYLHSQQQLVPYQDCSHWCLPGLPDIWNELLYFSFSKQMLTSL